MVAVLKQLTCSLAAEYGYRCDHYFGQTVLEMQPSRLPPLSEEATQEELMHFQEGTVTLISLVDKMPL